MFVPHGSGLPANYIMPDCVANKDGCKDFIKLDLMGVSYGSGVMDSGDDGTMGSYGAAITISVPVPLVMTSTNKNNPPASHGFQVVFVFDTIQVQCCITS
jgi:hypothetical protein